jgi:hypothetical protein
VDGKSAWACRFCDESVKQGFRNNARCIKHALNCLTLRTKKPALFDTVLDTASDSALGTKLGIKDAKTVADIHKIAFGLAKLRPRGRPPKRSKTEDGQAELNIQPFVDAGKLSRAEAIAAMQQRVDHLITLLICVCGVSPHVIRSSVWKSLMAALNPHYNVTCETTFTDTHIPREAALVRRKQIDILSEIRNLTLSYDGNTVRKNKGFYSAHATTPERATYFLNAHQGDDEAHTAKWISDKMMHVRTYDSL